MSITYSFAISNFFFLHGLRYFDVCQHLHNQSHQTIKINAIEIYYCIVITKRHDHMTLD